MQDDRHHLRRDAWKVDVELRELASLDVIKKGLNRNPGAPKAELTANDLRITFNNVVQIEHGRFNCITGVYKDRRRPMPDLPNDLEDLKEKGAPTHYQPPYEADQGFPPTPEVSEGEDIDYTKTREVRHPDLPDFVDSDNPTGGVDLAFQAGEQGDDDLHGFKDPKKALADSQPKNSPVGQRELRTVTGGEREKEE